MGDLSQLPAFGYQDRSRLLPQAGERAGAMAEGDDPQRPISLFYSYSHDDEGLLKLLKQHLAALRRAGLIAEWYDRDIDAGDEWAKEIDRNLSSADIILLLVSPSFIASEYCWSEEMTKAIARHERGDARVIPVILRHCRWTSTPLGRLQGVPKNGRPVTAWADPDEAFDDVVAGIERVVEELRSKRAPTARAEAVAPVEPAPVAATTVRKEEASTKPEAPAVVLKPGGAGVARVWVDARDLPDLAVFKDVNAPWCPEMVVIPAGSFLMGSDEKSPLRRRRKTPQLAWPQASPQHKVTIGYRFALGRYAVTVGEYQRFVEASGRGHEGGMHVWTGSNLEQDPAKSWRDPGFAQTHRHPVVGVNWRDAQAYVEWLSEETKQRYRLPSEAEWEYACRAGTTTPYSCGDAIQLEDANQAHLMLGKTTEVGAYPPNVWGLYDMHGNVSEWAEDAWHDNYEGAPADGSAWTDGKGKESSSERVLRGGSYGDRPGGLHSAARSRSLPEFRDRFCGFRVARAVD